MTKRKTLPKDFEQLVMDGKEEEIKDAFTKCDINAYGGYGKGNAFFFPISMDLMKWLLEQGANINYVNHYGDTPLLYHARHRNAVQTAMNLVRLGADVNYTYHLNQANALHVAIPTGNVDLIQCLLDAGTDIMQTDWQGNQPLESAFCNARPFDLVTLEPITRYLLAHGVAVTPKLQSYMYKVAKDVEFRRKDLNPDYVEELDTAMESLYELLEVAKVPRRELYDGTTRIEIKEKTWQKQYSELWNMLVPGSGHANTIQGEVIRLTGRISHEILDNGGINWDSDFLQMSKALNKYLHMGNCLSEQEYEELDSFFHSLKDAEETKFNRQAELAVKWVGLNRDPMKLESVSYRR